MSTTSYHVMQHMDLNVPLTQLRAALQQKLPVNLSKYAFYLQDTQILDDHKNLVDLCVEGEGKVQIDINVHPASKKIIILDVLKPASDYEMMKDKGETSSTEKKSIEMGMNNQEKTDNKNIIQWQVDEKYKKEQERLGIPANPRDWSVLHVRHWIQWAVRQFNLHPVKLNDWNMTGSQLFDITMQDFKRIIPNDPEDTFWTHLELLRKTNLVATKHKDQPLTQKITNSPKHNSYKILPSYQSTLKNNISPYNPCYKSNNNGHIQLWQFLLELLTNKDYKHLIQWTGRDNEFKFTHPEAVAHLWGERKKKSKNNEMNYEKLARALRYYYDGCIINKVQGGRFVYQFVCDLKQILGYSALELMNLLKYGNPLKNGL